MEYTVDGLLPFRPYEIKLSISNMYSLKQSHIDPRFSLAVHFTTREGGINFSMSHLLAV